jgi:hypothetical protein
MDLRRLGYEGVDWIIWLSTGVGGGHFEHINELLVFIKSRDFPD